MSSERTTEHARTALRRPTGEAAALETETTQHPLVALGGQLGNAQVARMLAQREGAEEEEIQAKHDDVAGSVGAAHAPPAMAKHDDVAGSVGAAHAAPAMAEVGLAGGPISSDLSGRIDSARGSGAGLDDGTRSTMERSFGTSFADVRVHTDAESDTLNRSVSAKAFTTGNDIFFRKDTSPGDHGLLAHELTHVVQQRDMGGTGGGMSVGAADSAHETHADTMAQAVTSGAAGSAAAQREADDAQVARAVAQREAAAEEEELTA